MATSRSQPGLDAQTLTQTQRIRSTSAFDASSLHGNDDHSVRAHAANSLHMPSWWSSLQPWARHTQSAMRLLAVSLTTYWCDDFAPTRVAHGFLAAHPLLMLDGEHLMSSTPPTELATVRRTYSVDEAAAILGISRTTAYECVKTKELPALRFRGRIVISAAVIDALLEGQPSSQR